MKLIRNKFIVGLLCIAIGAAAGFILLPRSQRNEISMTQVVRLTQNVKAGEQLTAENLETTTIPAANVPGDASSSVDTYRGKYAVTQLFAGDILTATKVRDTLADPVAAAAAKGKQLASITIPTLTSGVSGILQPGDVVSVMVTRKVTQFNRSLGLLVATEQSTVSSDAATVKPESDAEGAPREKEPVAAEETVEPSETNQALISSIQRESETTIPEGLRYLEVCKVSSSDGTEALVNPEKNPDVPNRLPATITFFVTEEQALKLAEIEQNGDIHIAFLARGDAADVYIPREERVLVEEAIPEPTPASTPEPETQETQATPEHAESAEPQVSEAPKTTPEPTESAEPEASEAPASEPTLEAMPTVEPVQTIIPSDIDTNDPEVGE